MSQPQDCDELIGQLEDHLMCQFGSKFGNQFALQLEVILLVNLVGRNILLAHLYAGLKQ